jgi:hypothetical protein
LLSWSRSSPPYMEPSSLHPALSQGTFTASIALTMEAVGPSWTSLIVYQTTWCSVPEDGRLKSTGVFTSHNKDEFLREGKERLERRKVVRLFRHCCLARNTKHSQTFRNLD